MTRTLPPNPSLEQFEKQAKDLRKGHQSVSTEAAERMQVILLTCRERAFRHLSGTHIAIG